MNRSAFLRNLSAFAAIAACTAANDALATLIPKPFDSITSQPPGLSIINPSLFIANDGGPLGSRVYFGTLNLNNNDLIVHAADRTAALTTYANIFDMVRSGFNHGDWLGTGITSGKAAADYSDGYECTALGVILNDDGSAVNLDGSGIPIWGGAGSLLGSFDGYSALSQYDVIVKYTFFGDTFLRGIADSFDATRVASGLSGGKKGWINGEFNYTGGPVTNLDMLELGRTLTYESRYPINTPVSDRPPPLVPEPSAVNLATVGLLGLVVSFRRLAQKRSTSAC